MKTFQAAETTSPDLFARVDPGVEFIAAGSGYLWVANPTLGFVQLLDPITGAVIRTIELGSGRVLLELEAVGDAVFVANFSDQTVLKLDSEHNKPVFSEDVPVQRGLFAGADGVWVACCGPDRPPEEGVLTLLDFNTGSVLASIKAESPEDLMVAFGRLWVVTIYPGRLTSFQLEGAVGPGEATSVDDVLWHIAAAVKTIWLSGSKALYEIEPLTMDIVTVVNLPAWWATGHPVLMTSNGALVVAAQRGADQVVVFDGVKSVTYGLEEPVGVSITADTLWVAGADGSIYRIDISAIG